MKVSPEASGSKTKAPAGARSGAVKTYQMKPWKMVLIGFAGLLVIAGAVLGVVSMTGGEEETSPISAGAGPGDAAGGTAVKGFGESGAGPKISGGFDIELGPEKRKFRWHKPKEWFIAQPEFRSATPPAPGAEVAGPPSFR